MSSQAKRLAAAKRKVSALTTMGYRLNTDPAATSSTYKKGVLRSNQQLWERDGLAAWKKGIGPPKNKTYMSLAPQVHVSDSPLKEGRSWPPRGYRDLDTTKSYVRGWSSGAERRWFDPTQRKKGR